MWWSMLKVCPLLLAVFFIAVGFYGSWTEDGNLAKATAIGLVGGGLAGILFGVIAACILYLPAQLAVDAFRGVFIRDRHKNP